MQVYGRFYRMYNIYYIRNNIHTVDKTLFTPKVMHIPPMLNTLIKSQLIETQTLILYLILFTEYERKYIFDAI